MADLGTLTCTVPTIKMQSLNIALAWNITNNPIACYGFNSLPKKEDWKTFSGEVKNEFGVGIARRVIALTRSDLKIVGETVSASNGVFSFDVPYDVDHIVFRLDDSENLVAVDHVNPV